MIALFLIAQVVLAGKITGDLLDPEGEVVSGGLVIAYDHRLNSYSGSSDELGHFSIEVVDDRQYWLQVLPPAGSGLAEELGLGEWKLCAAHRYEVGSQVEWPLRAAAVVSGRLVTGEGEPASDVDLTGWPVLSGDLAPATDTTDADGVFVLEGIHPAAGGIRIQASGEAWPTQYLPVAYEESDADLFPIVGGEQSEIGDQPLLRGITIAGEVLGPEGPVDGAMVRVYSPGKVRSTSAVLGWYEVAGLPPGEALSWASADGLATTYYPDADRPGDRVAVIEEGEVYTELDLNLPVEARLHGVLEAAGSVEGTSVLLYNDARTVGFGAQVDGDGRFEIGGLHGGNYTIELFGGSVGLTDDMVRDEHGGPRVVGIPAGGVLDIALELERGATLAVSARDMYSGEPVEGISITGTERFFGRVVAGTADRDGNAEVTGISSGHWDFKATYSRYCHGDPDWVPVYYPDGRSESDSLALKLAAGESAFWEVLVAPDHDSDEMDDVWEEANGLDPARADGDEDLDGDGLTNLEEYRAGTSPNDADVARGCGCRGERGGAGILWLPLLAIRRRSRSDAPP